MRMDAVGHISLLLCLAATLFSPTASLVLDEATINMSVTAARLSWAVIFEDYTDFPGTTFYEDGSDAAVFYESDTQCYVAFDGTTRSDWQDWRKNLDLRIDDICPIGNENGECCRARNGHEEGYTKPSYRTELDNRVIECYNEGSKEVVLTGHSLGGAIATAAGVGLSFMEPTIITFGQQPTIVGECPFINTDKYLRYINTDVNHFGVNLDYDPVPSVKFNADNTGQLIILGEDINNVVVYENGRSPPDIISWGFDIECHEVLQYRFRLESYLDQAQLETNGWAAGFRCNYDEECSSKHCGGWSWYWSSGTCT